MGIEPKSAYELAMERLRAADRESGVEESPLDDAQKAAIAEVRKVASARLAEREILFRDALARVLEPAEREKLEQAWQTDRERIERDRDREIAAVRERRG